MIHEHYNGATNTDSNSSASFLQELRAKTRAQSKLDRDLLDILESHILRDDPPENAAEQAFKAILNLAETRAEE